MTTAIDAVLVLEDGRVFRGDAYGAMRPTFGEAVFATGHDRVPGDADRPLATTGRSW